MSPASLKRQATVIYKFVNTINCGNKIFLRDKKSKLLTLPTIKKILYVSLIPMRKSILVRVKIHKGCLTITAKEGHLQIKWSFTNYDYSI